VSEKGINIKGKSDVVLGVLGSPQSYGIHGEMCMVCGKGSPEPIFIPSFPQFSTELGELSTVLGL
jgi:hypothetical protein